MDTDTPRSVINSDLAVLPIDSDQSLVESTAFEKTLDELRAIDIYRRKTVLVNIIRTVYEFLRKRHNVGYLPLTFEQFIIAEKQYRRYMTNKKILRLKRSIANIYKRIFGHKSKHECEAFYSFGSCYKNFKYGTGINNFIECSKLEIAIYDVPPNAEELFDQVWKKYGHLIE